ncbi:MAG: hypothetical protein E6I80_25340 [Chloroflexi bacterium]|nr:MAG: hypothetical protein E6I80_25340 [Chloroflexota bacterium]
MEGFYQQEQNLLWSREHEMVQIEPWGRDSLRVRATVNASIGESVVNALLPPAQADAQISIGEQEASITNGAIMARVSSQGLIRFSIQIVMLSC